MKVMDAKLADPNYVMQLRKTLGVCGSKQSQGRDLLEFEKTLFFNGKAELPVDISKNRKTIEIIREKLKMAGASDIEVLHAHVNGRVAGCKAEKAGRSLKALSAGHEICTYQPKGSERIHIQILRK